MKMVECIKKHVTPVGTQINDLTVLDGGLGIPVDATKRGVRGEGVKKMGDGKKYPYMYETPFFLFRSNNWRISTIISGLQSSKSDRVDRYCRHRGGLC